MNSDIVALENGHLGSRAVEVMSEWIEGNTDFLRRRAEERGDERLQRLYEVRREALEAGYRIAYKRGFMEGRNNGEMEMMGTMIKEAASFEEDNVYPPEHLGLVLSNLNEHAIEAIVFELLSRFGSEAFKDAVREIDQYLLDSGFEDHEPLFATEVAA